MVLILKSLFDGNWAIQTPLKENYATLLFKFGSVKKNDELFH